MKDIEAEITQLLSDRKRIESLLLLEKARRGARKDSLLFIAMANIAEYYWCAMKAVLKSRMDELGCFGGYLVNRISYSHRLGLIDRLPNKKEALLDIGNEIRFDDVEKLLRGKKGRAQDSSASIAVIHSTDDDGARIMVINPSLCIEERVWYERHAEAEGIRVADPEEYPKVRGEILETTRGERYPTISWNFEWGKYVIGGEPDGITDRFVYEFKTTRNRFLMSFIKPVGLTQADLYGYFFRRDKKRVQVYITDEGTTETWEGKVDGSEAERVLKDFGRVDAGWNPQPPEEWKCKACEFKAACRITSLSSETIQQRGGASSSNVRGLQPRT